MPLKRKLLVITLFAFPVLVVTPVFLLSTPMMEGYQRRIDRDPGRPSSKWLQMSSADWCSRTWRPEMAAARYRTYYERYTTDVRRPEALLRYAQSLEDAGQTADAKDIYQKYVIEYHDLEGAREAKIGINRIEKCRR